MRFAKGDVRAGFEEADLVIERRYTTKPVHQGYIEPHACLISSRPLEATVFQVENIRIAYVFYESGLSINVMYTIDDPNRRAVGFKLSEGMKVPVELASRFK